MTLAEYNRAAGKAAGLAVLDRYIKSSDGAADFLTYVRTQADGYYAQGALPIVVWHLWRPQNPTACHEPGFTEEFMRYTPRNIATGSLDRYLIAWADQAKAWGKFIMLRPWHESNRDVDSSDLCSRGARPNMARVTMNGHVVSTPTDLANAWRRVAGIFRARGVENVQWIFSGLRRFSGGVALKDMYPGDEVVNWLGYEVYNMLDPNWHNFNELGTTGYGEVAALSPDLPIMAVEMGSRENATKPEFKPNWFRDAFDPLGTKSMVRAFPRTKAFIYWNMTGSVSTLDNLAIESSPKSLASYRAQLSNPTYIGNVFSETMGNPFNRDGSLRIPVPGCPASDAKYRCGFGGRVSLGACAPSDSSCIRQIGAQTDWLSFAGTPDLTSVCKEPVSNNIRVLFPTSPRPKYFDGTVTLYEMQSGQPIKLQGPEHRGWAL